jgi:hypothetical protein
MKIARKILDNLQKIIKEELTKTINESRQAAPDARAAQLLSKIIKKTKLSKSVELIGPIINTDAMAMGVTRERGYEYTLVQFTLKTKKIRDAGTISPVEPKPKKKLSFNLGDNDDLEDMLE